MVMSRRGSGSLTLPSGQTLAIHTRTHDEEDLPHATKRQVELAVRIHFLDFIYVYMLLHLHILSGPWQIILGSTRACERITTTRDKNMAR